MDTKIIESEILDSINDIENITMESEMNTIGAILESCNKALTILENYEGEDLSAFSVFQEGYYLEADGNTEDNKRADGTYDEADGSKTVVKNGKEYNSKSGFRRAKADGSGVESIFKSIGAALFRLMSLLFNKIKSLINGDNKKPQEVEQLVQEVENEKKVNFIVKGVDILKEIWTAGSDYDSLKNKLLSLGIPVVAVSGIILLAKSINKIKDAINKAVNKHGKTIFNMSDADIEEYKKSITTITTSDSSGGIHCSFLVDLKRNKLILPFDVVETINIADIVSVCFEEFGNNFTEENLKNIENNKLPKLAKRINKALAEIGNKKIFKITDLKKKEFIAYNNERSKQHDRLQKLITSNIPQKIKNAIDNIPDDYKKKEQLTNLLNEISKNVNTLVSMWIDIATIEQYTYNGIINVLEEQKKSAKWGLSQTEEETNTEDTEKPEEETNTEDTEKPEEETNTEDTEKPEEETNTNESWYPYY